MGEDLVPLHTVARFICGREHHGEQRSIRGIREALCSAVSLEASYKIM
jgi:hypothetical protein